MGYWVCYYLLGLLLGLSWACRPLIFFENPWACLLFCYNFFFGLESRTNIYIYIYIIEGVLNFF